MFRFDAIKLGKFAVIISLLGIIITVSGCKENKTKKNAPLPVEIPDKKVDLVVNRFEEDLFKIEKFDSVKVASLKNKYGEFFDLWCLKLSGIASKAMLVKKDNKVIFPISPELVRNLQDYTHDQYIQEVYKESKKQFANFSEVNEGLTNAFTRYHVTFPNKAIPSITTYLSPFYSSIAATEKDLGIGLHSYLGSDYKYYPSTGQPMYLIRKFRKEYIVTDAIKGWLDSDYMNDSTEQSFLNQIIYQGKVIYAIELLVPEADDTIKMGYTAKQLDWAFENEKNIWKVFIDNNLLFSNKPKLYLKFINDGNTTSGFPKEAPAKLGGFIGWQIVRSYMKKHEGVSLDNLFKMNDGKILLNESGYKPSQN
ncbi:MAG: hypothetical protein ACKOX3_11940 [Bacteroidota bacterium]